MKKRLLITIIATFMLLLAGLGVNYLLSLRKVTFTLQEGTEQITVFNSSDKIIKELSSKAELLLQKGDYYVVPKGENIASNKIKFSVTNKDMTLDIQPSYTDDFLAERLKDETKSIEAAIAKKYSSVFAKYTLSQGKLYGRGEWFGGLLKPKVSDIRDERDPYRIVLHKENDEWQVVRRPEYSLSSSRYQEVPIDILRKINAIVGEPGN